ncbi:DUF6745 domain-containing protein [Acaryochloris sp. IP29b_bin.148]|uniref:DUF6745 domain-containing protein n=1 Tax=Acaryochloris sp. IP29b_bin.148 TaxID=2969218 RepID=UPI00260B3117|nr:hypothetical protein [Acaryochloris sp. IP29b_bin.148]
MKTTELKISAFTAQEAIQLILEGKAPTAMQVDGPLSFANSPQLRSEQLPETLVVSTLYLHHCSQLITLPPQLQVRNLNLRGCSSLSHLPSHLKCYQLDLSGTAVSRLPDSLQVAYKLDLSDCQSLERLPDHLKVGTLILRNCRSLSQLPEGLSVSFLDISGCPQLQTWPQQIHMGQGGLYARGCVSLTDLPTTIGPLAQLDISGCSRLQGLPEGLRVSSWADIADTGITQMPASLQGVQLRWRDVFVEERIVLRPETITVDEILTERNAEIRRVLLERFGYDRFMLQAQAEVLDTDADPGGERRLLRVPLEGDEDLVCLSVFCPSTADQYIIRVPPAMQSCHQAAAWIAGFDDPDQYQPLVET